MADRTDRWFAVHAWTDEPDEHGDEPTIYAICRDADALGNFVRVNAFDAGNYRVLAVEPEHLALLAISEGFDE